MPLGLPQDYSTGNSLIVLTAPGRNVYLCARDASLVVFVQVGDGGGCGTASDGGNAEDSPTGCQCRLWAETHYFYRYYVARWVIARWRLDGRKRGRMVACRWCRWCGTRDAHRGIGGREQQNVVPDHGEIIGLSAACLRQFGSVPRGLGAATNRCGSVVGGGASFALTCGWLCLELG